MIVPFFLMGTFVQHAVDLETWFPVEETTGVGNPIMEILEEHSLEDDIQSKLNVTLMSNLPLVNPLLGEFAFNNFELTVPTPPPDLT